MITVEQAEEILAGNLYDCSVEEVPIEGAFGRILAQPLLADRDFPPFNRVMMDGIAISYESYAKGQNRFKIASTIAAGTAPYTLKDQQHCVEIMTGAVLPNGADTVIRYEDVSIDQEHAQILITDIVQGSNIHRQGTDRKQGDTIVKAGAQILGPEIGIAATVGQSTVKVQSMPKVVLISTGDELVEVDDTPASHQIRGSNGHVLSAALQAMGINAVRMHLGDSAEGLRRTISDLLESFDLLLFLGGSSKGKYDFVPSALKQCGVKEQFYKLRQRPGKPLWFGTMNGSHFAFALPGNPVSAFLCFEKYVKYWLNKSLGLSNFRKSAMLAQPVTFGAPLTYFMQVCIVEDSGRRLAYPVKGKGSGDLANLVEADAFIELPADRDHFAEGEVFPILPFRSN